MDNRKTIQTALDYIEENLKAEISVSDLSDMTGYSLYHFYRLFQSAVGMPVMQYILRRKLLNAIYDISSGLSKTDAALLYLSFKCFCKYDLMCSMTWFLTNSILIQSDS